jgi:phosphomevalonate kinase
MSAGPSTTTTETIVSAPGKVLLAGGYLVLDRQYTGLVVATSSRFFCAVRDGGDAGRVSVRAGQFPADASVWSYDVTAEDTAVLLSQAVGGKNKFVELTLRNVFQYAAERLGADELSKRLATGLDIVVLADNDFYSQRQQVG